MPIANLTVGIATLDRPNGLARCLDGLLAGAQLPAEVIVVDQGHGDAARSVVEQRQGGAVPIVYVHQDRRGLSTSRNAVVTHANHPVVGFLDDDCVPDHHWVAVLDRTLTVPSAPDAVTGRILPLGPAASGFFVVSPRESQQPVDYRGRAVPWDVGSGGNLAVKREWFTRGGLYDERLGAGSPGKAAEDMDLCYRLLRSGAHIRYDPEAIVYHERQTKAQRLASRRSYGYGLGAFFGMLLRRHDPYALYLLWVWLRFPSRELARELASLIRGHGTWFEVYQRLLSLQGTAGGLVYGLRQNGSVARPASVAEQV